MNHSNHAILALNVQIAPKVVLKPQLSKNAHLRSNHPRGRLSNKKGKGHVYAISST